MGRIAPRLTDTRGRRSSTRPRAPTGGHSGGQLVGARGQAVWIPSNVHHEVYAHGSVEALMLFVDSAYTAPLPTLCGTVEVSLLLIELLRRAVDYDYGPSVPEARLARKTRLRLVQSIERLSRGSSVTEVALDLGYGSTSAFVYMFRKNLGASPGRYARR